MNVYNVAENYVMCCTLVYYHPNKDFEFPEAPTDALFLIVNDWRFVLRIYGHLFSKVDLFGRADDALCFQLFKI